MNVAVLVWLSAMLNGLALLVMADVLSFAGAAAVLLLALAAATWPEERGR